MHNEGIFSIILTIIILYGAYKIGLILWRKVFIPTTRFIWKGIIALCTILFFVFLIIFRETLFDTFRPEVKYFILAVIGIFAGIKYLKNKRN